MLVTVVVFALYYAFGVVASSAAWAASVPIVNLGYA